MMRFFPDNAAVTRTLHLYLWGRGGKAHLEVETGRRTFFTSASPFFVATQSVTEI